MAETKFGFQIGSSLATGFLTDSKYIKGGYTVVADITARDALDRTTEGTITKGSLVYVQSEDKIYKYNGTAYEEFTVGGDSIQVKVLPEITDDNKDKVYQYVGDTTADYTKGYFYEAKNDTLTIRCYYMEGSGTCYVYEGQTTIYCAENGHSFTAVDSESELTEKYDTIPVVYDPVTDSCRVVGGGTGTYSRYPAGDLQSTTDTIKWVAIKFPSSGDSNIKVVSAADYSTSMAGYDPTTIYLIS